MCEENVPIIHGGRQKSQIYLPYEPEMTLYFRFTGTVQVARVTRQRTFP